MLNQNKHAITLNLKHERGRALLFEMAERADVLLENFSPGTMDDLGVGWSRLHELNPRLIYASGTGFGISGPDRDNLAMDMTIQAASGIMSVTGFPDGPPVKAGPTLVDFMGGIHLYAGILTALYDRDRSGVGRLVEVAMQETVYPTLGGELRLLLPDRRDPAAHRQPPIRAQQRALQCLSDRRRACRDPCRHRGAFPEPAEGDGPRGPQGRPALCDQCRPRRAYGRDRRIGRSLDPHLAQDGGVRAHQGLPHPVRPGAQRTRSHERRAHAWARDAGTGRPPRIGGDRRAVDAVAPARHRQGRDAAQPDDRPAQCRDLWRLARPLCRRDRELQETGVI